MNNFIEIISGNGRFIFNTSDEQHPAYYKTYKVKTLSPCIDEDWKTHIAKRKETIPTNMEFDNWNIFTNLYGQFIRVTYNYQKYDIKAKSVAFIKKQGETEC